MSRMMCLGCVFQGRHARSPPYTGKILATKRVHCADPCGALSRGAVQRHPGDSGRGRESRHSSSGDPGRQPEAAAVAAHHDSAARGGGRGGEAPQVRPQPQEGHRRLPAQDPHRRQRQPLTCALPFPKSPHSAFAVGYKLCISVDAYGTVLGVSQCAPPPCRPACMGFAHVDACV